MTIVNKKCLDCGKDFEYDEKPGYPRKYCFSCSAERKKSYSAKQEDKPVTPEAPKPVGNKNATMYVSYAKDIFCCLVNESKDSFHASDLMKQSIGLVKQARGEFE